MIPALVVAFLILLNGLFVAAEFAIVGVSRPAIARRAARGGVARVVQRILADTRQQDMYIATAQLGITAASVGLGMYGEHVMAAWFEQQLVALGAARWVAAHAAASVLAVALLTYLHIVLGEMVPKSLALQQPERTVLAVTPPLLWLRTILYPAVVGLNGVGNGILRLLGIRRRPSAAEHYYTPEELQYIIEESQAHGLLRREAGEVLRRLLEFADRIAGEVMTPRVDIVGIPVHAPPEAIRRIVIEHPHTRYLVYDEDLDHVVGAIQIKEFLRQVLDGRPLSAAASRPRIFVPETTSLERVLELMHQQRMHMLVVIDEQGGTAGVVSIEDLIEEVVGEIEESPAERPDLYRDNAGRVHAAGRVRLDEVGEALGVEVKHDEVDTVSGLVLHLLERPARLGDAVVYGPLRIEVVAVAGHGVREAVVSIPPTPHRTGGA